MKFAFIVHPLSEETKTFMHWDRSRGLSRQVGADLLQLCAAVHDSLAAQEQAGRTSPHVCVADEMQNLVSWTGASAEGRVYEIPLDAYEILADPVRAMEYVEDATQRATDWGARVIGLGSLTGIIGGQGTYLAERCPVAVTTGNSLTVYAALRNLYQAALEAEIELRNELVAVVGIPGSIAAAAARLLAPHCGKLILVGRRPSSRADQLATELDAELSFDIEAALAKSRVVLSATSTGNCIEQSWLRPGALVVDVAVPTDVCGGAPERSDVLILSGGLTRVPDTMPLNSVLLGFHRGVIPSCLGETMVLALEHREECFSLGRNLEIDGVQEIGAIAASHGFDFSQLISFGLSVQPSMLVQYRKAAARRRKAARAGGKQPKASSAPSATDLAARAAALHSRHIDPLLLALGAKSGFTKTFVRGEGTRLWDAEGQEYHDFVSGFGSLNLGHNHPRVVEAVTKALQTQAPGFAQSAVNPYAATLAERLISIAPDPLEMVFFANSGTEAVEAALKLARIATGRTGFVYCDRSYHGKTLGSLSVTGNLTYQRPFAPLVPECASVLFGDLESLKLALMSRRHAAFIVEPIQAEGGMHVPPEGYLQAAHALCRETGTLLIVDEVQTGLGRTGTLFAVDAEGVEPDVMTLAKSLGGGLMPIGAMLTRRDLWNRAYGTIQRLGLHTSTFGGGSLACAAGLAAIQAILDERLAENAQARGEQLCLGLQELCEKHSTLKAVRGRGLLLGVEFNPVPSSMVRHFRQTDPSGLLPYLVPDLDEAFMNLGATYVMQTLLADHHIYTQVTRSNPRVLRVQPPLTITAEEVERFLRAFDTACHESSLLNRATDTIISRSTLGLHEGNASSSEPGSAARAN
jgi:acetylornithine/succinyldiaminopimelate/putrescine aminotransferase/predicted amino acid dehydrogenase